MFILRCGDLFALEKRPDTGLLAGLWQLPNVPGALTAGETLAQAAAFGLRVRNIRRIAEKKHIFTHIQWNMTGVYLDVEEPAGNYTWLDQAQIEAQQAMPTAFRQFWEERDYV